MQHAYSLGGGTIVIKRYKVNSAVAAGVIVMRQAEGGAATGLITSTTTSAADAVGVVVDQGENNAGGPNSVYSTTDRTVGSECVYGVIVNPDAVWRILMVGGAANEAVRSTAVNVASTDGLTVKSAFDYNSPDMDGGVVWYTSGAYVGQSRKITSTSSTAITVIHPFSGSADAVGDTFQAADYFTANLGITLSTDLLNARVDLAATGAELITVDTELNGTRDSYIHAMLEDHVFAGQAT
jgi:hypothetical protein